ncbi:hypothetical protein [Noviherbaspirillum sp.]
MKIAAPFYDFKGTPIPTRIRKYEEYRSASISFIEARSPQTAR